MPQIRERVPAAQLEFIGVGPEKQRYQMLLDGESGFKVQPGQPDPFADRILALLLNHEQRKSMGQRARQHFEENFSNRNLARHAQWLEQMLKRSPNQLNHHPSL